MANGAQASGHTSPDATIHVSTSDAVTDCPKPTIQRNMEVTMLVVGLISNEFEIWAINSPCALRGLGRTDRNKGHDLVAGPSHMGKSEQMHEEQQHVPRCLARVRCSHRLLLYCLDLIVERGGPAASFSELSLNPKPDPSSVASGGSDGSRVHTDPHIVIKAASGVCQSDVMCCQGSDYMRRACLPYDAFIEAIDLFLIEGQFNVSPWMVLTIQLG
jgi:hypothetical protein